MHLPIKVVVALVVVNFPDPSSRQNPRNMGQRSPLIASSRLMVPTPLPAAEDRVVGNQALVLINFG